MIRSFSELRSVIEFYHSVPKYVVVDLDAHLLIHNYVSF